MKLTDHFSLEELTHSDLALRKGIKNDPTPDVISNLTRLAGLLEQIRKHLNKPISINSGYRCPELNQAVGGQKASQHLLGCAADIRVSGMTPDEVVRAVIASDLGYDQVIREFDRWTHISIPNEAARSPRKQALIIDKQGTRLFA